VKQLFAEWLEEHYPLRARRVLSLVRQCRGGALNDPSFGSRMRGTGALSALIQQRFDVARRKNGLDRTPAPLDHTHFRIPPRPGDQGDLFET
jgi:DNA repair photolyase